jgi:hypothetical protein
MKLWRSRTTPPEISRAPNARSKAGKLRILTVPKKLREPPETFSFFATILQDRRSNCAKFAFNEFRKLTSREVSKAGYFRPNMSLRQLH